MRIAQKKILPVAELKKVLGSLRGVGKRVVFTNGCFDLLHVGHVRYLEKARALGDLLVVGLNSDSSVRGLKGEGRPVVPETERAEVLSALECVDFVTIFSGPTPAELIEELLPDVLAKGGDWPPDQIVGRDTVEAGGGEVVSLEFEEGKSTSGIIESIRKIP